MPHPIARDSPLIHLPAPPCFRLATAAALALAFAGTRPELTVIPVRLADPDVNPAWAWSVDELEWWNGRPLPFVLAQLGLPDSLDDYGPPVPDEGVWRGVQEQLDIRFPGYADWVRTMAWHRDGVNHRVFLVIIDGQWLVLDAVTWADGVEF